MELKKTDEQQIISPEKNEENAQGIFYINGNFRTFYREGKKIGEVFFLKNLRKKLKISGMRGCSEKSPKDIR